MIGRIIAIVVTLCSAFVGYRFIKKKSEKGENLLPLKIGIGIVFLYLFPLFVLWRDAPTLVHDWLDGLAPQMILTARYTNFFSRLSFFVSAIMLLIIIITATLLHREGKKRECLYCNKEFTPKENEKLCSIKCIKKVAESSEW